MGKKLNLFPKLKLPKKRLDLFNDAPEVAKFAEAAILEADQVLDGERGRKKLHAVADTLNEWVDIPMIPEPIEGILFRAVAEIAYGFTKEKLAKARAKRAKKKRSE